MLGILGVLTLLGAAGCAKSAYVPQPVKAKDSPESKVGERIFRDPRFSNFYFKQAHGNVNAKLPAGDPVLSRMNGPRGDFSNPFQGQAMTCVACHMVDDAAKIKGAGTRAYTDFSERSPVPDLGDGHFTTPRRSPPLVGASIPRSGDTPFFLHWDGQFASIEDLVKDSYTGRNFGWQPTDRAIAVKNFANVMRNDDGQGDLARTFGGGAYSKIIGLNAQAAPASLKISDDYRLDVATADDETVFDAAAKLVTAYLKALEFSKDNDGQYNGSPYDKFLEKNKLPRKPNDGESDDDYAGRLSWAIAQLTHPIWVKDSDGEFDTHVQDFEFGGKELTGLQIFLARTTVPDRKQAGFARVGNCAACHSPPNFTDFKFHNTGAAQEEYDAVHGDGTFAQLEVPDWNARQAKPEQYFGASVINPNGIGQFISIPVADKPGFADLWMWNVYGNPSFPKPQTFMTQLLCDSPNASCDPASLLPNALARFKTPGLRDLGHSDPYLHTGRKKSIEDVLVFYIQMADKTHASQIRNPDPEMAKVNIKLTDVEPLAAFLRSLNEDYD